VAETSLLYHFVPVDTDGYKYSVRCVSIVVCWWMCCIPCAQPVKLSATAGPACQRAAWRSHKESCKSCSRSNRSTVYCYYDSCRRKGLSRSALLFIAECP